MKMFTIELPFPTHENYLHHFLKYLYVYTQYSKLCAVHIPLYLNTIETFFIRVFVNTYLQEYANYSNMTNGVESNTIIEIDRI
jgi:hypothetical protein